MKSRNDSLMRSRVVIVSDDREFARALMARWQAERHVPEITLTPSDVWTSASAIGYPLVIVGPLRPGKILAILRAVDLSAAAVYVVGDEACVAAVKTEYPELPVLLQRAGWVDTVVLLANEGLGRAEASARAARAERIVMLGRYMIEMRHSINDALTSLIGNADILLADQGRVSPRNLDQVKTIHAMALRLNEIMQRFSSLAVEMQKAEKESQAESEVLSPTLLRES
jgi:signal transduction histidine kinase